MATISTAAPKKAMATGATFSATRIIAAARIDGGQVAAADPAELHRALGERQQPEILQHLWQRALAAAEHQHVAGAQHQRRAGAR